MKITKTQLKEMIRETIKMKITKAQLREMIREELLNEGTVSSKQINALGNGIADGAEKARDTTEDKLIKSAINKLKGSNVTYDRYKVVTAHGKTKKIPATKGKIVDVRFYYFGSVPSFDFDIEYIDEDGKKKINYKVKSTYIL